jgi:hypothetical protein
MKKLLAFSWIALFLSGACGLAPAAEPFAPVGTKAVLTVDYLYVSSGRKSSQGMYDPYEWRVKRNLSMEAQLAAHVPTALPTLQAMDSAQVASMQGQQAKAQAMAMNMAPMQRDMEKMIARCGDDEACITREVQGMGNAMAADPKKMAALNSAKKDAQGLTPGAMRYQSWRPTLQKGSYLIDELVQISVTDPICTSKPRHRCTREETRKGSGEVPAPAAVSARDKAGAMAGISAVEVDAGKNMAAIMLPVPVVALPYTETITSDEPDGTHDTPIPRGARKREGFFRVSAGGSGGYSHDKPIIVALKGGWRDQSGEQVVKLPGDLRDGGTLTVRWRFKVL